MTTTHDDVLDELVTLVDPVESPVATAPELAEKVLLGRRAVLDRLRILEARGDVASKTVGAHAKVWWPLPSAVLSEEPTEEVAPLREPTKEPSKEAAEREASPPDSGGEHVEFTLLREELAETLPGSGKKAESRADAVGACVEYLRDRGEASRSDFQRDVYPEHSAMFGSEGGWWNAIGKTGLAFVAERDSRVEPADTHSPWRWVDG